MKFLGNVLATLVGLFIFSGFGILIMVVWIAALSAEEKVTLEEDSFLHLKFDKVLMERSAPEPFPGMTEFGSIGVLEVIEAVDFAASDEKVAGIFLDLNFIFGGFAQIEEIRNALIEFKESGKVIYAYSEYMSEGAYYLASVADSIFLHPAGDLEFNGISYQMSFLKGTFDKLDIEPQVFRVGEFKSAVEPFVRKDMSEENRMQVSSFVNSIYDVLISNMAASRGIDPIELKMISSELQVHGPDDALRLGLVDVLGYGDHVFSSMKKSAGLEEDDDLPLVGYRRYLDAVDTYSVSSNRIAVIVASGEIVFGKGDQDVIGAETFVEEIRKARKNDAMKAIVLRINSPGGNIIATDDLWREISLASEAKPVIASMSNYAASGGYYMAMAADTVVAYPTTITGSIGIFTILFNLGDFMENKLGITSDAVNTGDYSDMYTSSRALTDFEKEVIQEQTQDGYDTFVSKVADARKMTVEEVVEIAAGRVWTGQQALDIGLVDQLGFFSDAVEIAARKAGIEDDYRLVYYPEKKNFWEQIFSEFSSNAETRVMKNKLGDLYPYVKQIQGLEKYKGIQARMPFDIRLGF